MARRAATSYDERDVKVRPGRGSRPRSKLRPAHADAEPGLVVAVDRGRYTCVVDGRTVTAMTARELGRKAVVVGDRVGLVGDVSGREGTLARIVRVEQRATVLRRTADDDDAVERVIVANAEQMMIVTAVADPEPRPRLVDRCLVAAFDAGVDPLLCVTKSDLADPTPLLASYAPLDIPTVVIGHHATSERELARLREHVRDRTTVLVGHSGVGKSTLVNALVPGADRAIGEVNVVTGRGRHTSTNAVALPLPDGGWVIDTPGIRSFGLAHVDPSRLILAFPDLAAETDACPRGCTHGETEPECALDTALADARLDPDRVGSYRRLLASRERQAGD
ncbi:ribosome small subunit-dependent GTPase A [Haloactinopolyspora sp.]|uniref:ribosome small subunit-dependent GTPase A n=1 Tax=Haloactinopolyspora sp. TaxID=1966353 RepID=UPI002610FE68|nr:ribosome small subunit-dependent GTPase A [Haloactinopolyspora sp.]